MSISLRALEAAFPQFSRELIQEVFQVKGDETLDALLMLATTGDSRDSASMPPSSFYTCAGSDQQSATVSIRSTATSEAEQSQSAAQSRSTWCTALEPDLEEDLSETRSCPGNYEDLNPQLSNDLHSKSSSQSATASDSEDEDNESELEEHEDDSTDSTNSEIGDELEGVSERVRMRPCTMRSISPAELVGERDGEDFRRWRSLDVWETLSESALPAHADREDLNQDWVDTIDGLKEDVAYLFKYWHETYSTSTDRPSGTSVSAAATPERVPGTEPVAEQQQEDDEESSEGTSGYLEFLQKSCIRTTADGGMHQASGAADKAGDLSLPPGVLSQPPPEIGAVPSSSSLPETAQSADQPPSDNAEVVRYASVPAIIWETQHAHYLDMLTLSLSDFEASTSKQEQNALKKQVKLFVAQIARSRRKVEQQTNQILKFLAKQEEMDCKLFCLDRLAKFLVDACISGEEDIATTRAHVASQLILECPELLRLLLGHLHRATPLTIPMYWSYQSGSIEGRKVCAKKMKALRAGQELNEDDYLLRCGGVITFHAALIAVPPISQQDPLAWLAPEEVCYGVAAGWSYLARFINGIPPNRTTAALLSHFLRIAGHKLHEQYKDQFVKLLRFVDEKWLNQSSQCGELGPGAVSRVQNYIRNKDYLQFPVALTMPETHESQRIRT